MLETEGHRSMCQMHYLTDVCSSPLCLKVLQHVELHLEIIYFFK